MARELLRKRLLFVDDEASIRMTLPRILGKYGFEVTSVGSVDEAEKEIRSHKFDALLSDLNLPLPDEGFLVIQTMRRYQPRCVNFILTGYPAEAGVEKAAEEAVAQVAHYFTKPVDIQELVKTVLDKLGATPKSEC